MHDPVPTWLTPENVLWGLFVVALLHVFFPRVFWFLSYGWKFRGDVEPSGLWLFFNCVGGIIAAGVIAYAIYLMRHPEIPPPAFLHSLPRR